MVPTTTEKTERNYLDDSLESEIFSITSKEALRISALMGNTGYSCQGIRNISAAVRSTALLDMEFYDAGSEFVEPHTRNFRDLKRFSQTQYLRFRDASKLVETSEGNYRLVFMSEKKESSVPERRVLYALLPSELRQEDDLS